MKKQSRPKRPSAGSRIIASRQDVAVRVTTVEVPVIDVKTMRNRLGLSPADFAAKFGFQAATTAELGARADVSGRSGACAAGSHCETS